VPFEQVKSTDVIMKMMDHEIGEQKRVAEENCHRRIVMTIAGSITGLIGGVLMLVSTGFDLRWLLMLSCSGGVISFFICQWTTHKSAKCPERGGDWEMHALQPTGVPNAKFYLKKCPYCALKIAD
jgi:hypothetical protein